MDIFEGVRAVALDCDLSLPSLRKFTAALVISLRRPKGQLYQGAGGCWTVIAFIEALPKR